MSPLLTPTEVGRILGISQPKMIITCDPLLPLVQAALSTMENQVQIIFFAYDYFHIIHHMLTPNPKLFLFLFLKGSKLTILGKNNS